MSDKKVSLDLETMRDRIYERVLEVVEFAENFDLHIPEERETLVDTLVSEVMHGILTGEGSGLLGVVSESLKERAEEILSMYRDPEKAKA